MSNQLFQFELNTVRSKGGEEEGKIFNHKKFLINSIMWKWLQENLKPLCPVGPDFNPLMRHVIVRAIILQITQSYSLLSYFNQKKTTWSQGKEADYCQKTLSQALWQKWKRKSWLKLLSALLQSGKALKKLLISDGHLEPVFQQHKGHGDAAERWIFKAFLSAQHVATYLKLTSGSR